MFGSKVSLFLTLYVTCYRAPVPRMCVRAKLLFPVIYTPLPIVRTH